MTATVRAVPLHTLSATVNPCAHRPRSFRHCPLARAGLLVRLHAFVALTVTSLLVAVLGGISLADIAGVIEEGMGSTLGYIAGIIGL